MFWHDFDDGEPPGYGLAKRRLRAMRRQCIEHWHPQDPDCPEFDLDDVDEAERELDRNVG